MKAKINLPLSKIADGSVQAKLNIELQKVMENILDPNTKAKGKRTITTKMTFTPNDARDRVDLDVDFKTGLAPVDGVSTLILTEQSDGVVYANELKSGTKGQTYFDPEDGKMKTDTGTPIEEVEAAAEEKKNTKILDLQKAQQTKEG
jgi:hypothetical protein